MGRPEAGTTVGLGNSHFRSSASPLALLDSGSMRPARASTEQDHRERILRVVVHLQEHLDDALDVEELSSVAHLSAFHFHRVFRALVGETAMEHVRRLRLERAARQLRYTDDPVIQIALASGYEAHEAFTRAFGSRFGLPPVEYRRQLRGPAPAADGVCAVPTLRALATEAQPEVQIRSLQATRVAFARHVGPYEQVGEAWGRLMAFAAQRGRVAHPAFALVYDDPEVTAPERFRYDACLEVGPEIAAEGAIGIQLVPAGRFAVALHRGPYEALSQTYGVLLAGWAPRHACAMAGGPSIERYLNDPHRTRAPDLQTEVWLRLDES